MCERAWLRWVCVFAILIFRAERNFLFAATALWEPPLLATAFNLMTCPALICADLRWFIFIKVLVLVSYLSANACRDSPFLTLCVAGWARVGCSSFASLAMSLLSMLATSALSSIGCDRVENETGTSTACDVRIFFELTIKLICPYIYCVNMTCTRFEGAVSESSSRRTYIEYRKIFERDAPCF